MSDPMTTERAQALLNDAIGRQPCVRQSELDALRSVLALHARVAEVERERDEARRVAQWSETLGTVDTASSYVPFAVYEAVRNAAVALREYGRLLRSARTSVTISGSIVTMHQCAALVGCAVADYSAVEMGRRPPFDEATTRRLCAFLGCDPQPLLDAAARAEEVLRG